MTSEPVEVMAVSFGKHCGKIYRARAAAVLKDLDAAGYAVIERSLVEQAFRDGLAYGSNVENADPDVAWQQSRVRSMLSASQVKP